MIAAYGDWEIKKTWLFNRYTATMLVGESGIITIKAKSEAALLDAIDILYDTWDDV